MHSSTAEIQTESRPIKNIRTPASSTRRQLFGSAVRTGRPITANFVRCSSILSALPINNELAVICLKSPESIKFLCYFPSLCSGYRLVQCYSPGHGSADREQWLGQ